jgi:hypothetical protein
MYVRCVKVHQQRMSRVSEGRAYFHYSIVEERRVMELSGNRSVTPERRRLSDQVSITGLTSKTLNPRPHRHNQHCYCTTFRSGPTKRHARVRALRFGRD